MSFPNMQASPVSVGKYQTQNGTTDTGPRSVAAERQLRAQYRAAAVEDMAHKAVKLDTVTFRDTFFPLPEGVSLDDRPQWDRDIFKGVEDAKNMTEAKISEAFIMALNTVTGLTPNLTLAESQHCPDQGDAAGLKVDAGFFRPNFVPMDRRPHWADQIVPVEFKPHDTARDPYDDRPKMPLDSGTITRKQVRGQIIHYAEQIFKYQHRTELYMLLILGRRYRFLRWDRSGTIVTPSMDYFEDPDLLCEILWRMSLLSDQQLGLDPTAERILSNMTDFEEMNAAAVPRSSDVDHADRVVSEDEVIPKDFVFRYVREAFATSLDPTWPRYCLSVPHGTGVRKFLVGKPTFRACGMAGRGTRGYVALDCETGHFVWLKDAWRTYYDLVEQEGAVLLQLNGAGVQSVPTLLCHGDIRDQATRTPDFWKPTNPPAATSPKAPPPRAPSNPSSSRTLAVEPQLTSTNRLKRGRSEVNSSEATLPNGEPHGDCPLRRHKHYRVVVEEVCMPLVAFQKGRQLLEIVLDCVMAHRDATREAHIVHRDVSAGNILILPKLGHDPQTQKRLINWTGILVDWELSKPIGNKDLPPRARQPERTGTWQYMSVATLNDHAKAIETSDEMEAFLHVTLYQAVRYLPSNCTTVGSFIENFFDSYTYEDGKYRCGEKKFATMHTGTLALTSDTDVLRFDSPMDDFFYHLLKVFQAHYAVAKYEAKQRKNAKQAAIPQVPPPAIPDPSSPTPEKPARFNMSMIKKSRLYTFSPEITTTETKAPEPEQRATALMAQDHDFVVSALMHAIQRWPPRDERVASDKVPVTFTPMCAVGPTPVTSVASVKKRRTDGAAAEST